MNTDNSSKKEGIKIPTLYIWGSLVIALLGYYYFSFGLESPWENLYGDYSNRVTYTSWGKTRQNVPTTPDKFVTLLALGACLIHLSLAWLKKLNIKANIITRLLWLVGILGLLPMGMYAFTYTAILLGVAVVLGLLYLLIMWLVKGNIKTS